MKKILLFCLLAALGQIIVAQHVPKILNLKNLHKAEKLEVFNPGSSENPETPLQPKDYDASLYTASYLPTIFPTMERYILNPPYSSMLSSEVQKEGDLIYLSGAYIKNVGNLPLTGCKFTNTITHFPLPSGTSTKVYERTSTDLVDIDPDSIRGVVMDQPFDFKNGKGPGRYQVQYKVLMDSTDQTPADNSYTTQMYLSKNILAKSRVNPTTKSLGTPNYWGGGSNYREVAMPFSLKYGKGLFIDSLISGIASNEGVADISIEGRIYKFTDKSGDGQLQNDEIELIAIGSYTVPSTVSGNFVNFRMSLDNIVGSTPHYQIEEDGTLFFATVAYQGGSKSLFNAYEMVPSYRMLFNVKEAAMQELQYEDFPYLSIREIDAASGNPDIEGASLFYVDDNGDATAQDEEIFFFPAAMAVEFSGVVGTSDVTRNSDIQLTVNPNPAREIANISIQSASASKCLLEIYNTQGKIINKENITLQGEYRRAFDVTNLNGGTYIVKATTDKGSVKRVFNVIK